MRFSPYAWAKWQYLRDLGDTEIACFGITEPDDLLLVTDLAMVAQKATSVSVAFDDEAVADYFEQRLDAGLKVEQFFRVWLHTHPGCSAEPSGVDEETFIRVFGDCHWAVMGILAKGGQRYARMRFGVGPCGELRVPVRIDWSQPFSGADHDAWRAEYELCVKRRIDGLELTVFDPAGLEDPHWLDEFAIDDDALNLAQIAAEMDEPEPSAADEEVADDA